MLASIDDNDITGLDLVVKCLSCHGAEFEREAGMGLGFHDETDKSCLICHSFHETDFIKARGIGFRLDFRENEQLASCIACHGQGMSLSDLSPSHRYAAAIYHNDYQLQRLMSPSDLCLICHSTEARTTAFDLDNINPPRFHEIASHPYGVEVRSNGHNSRMRIRSDIDPRVILFNGRIECQTCHSLTSRNDDYLVRVGSYEQLCLSCHEHNR
jgi:predicted CXXCH cytochrome family protein